MKRPMTAQAILKMYQDGKFGYDDCVILLKIRACYSQEDVNRIMPIFKRQRERLELDERIDRPFEDYSENSTMNHVQQGL